MTYSRVIACRLLICMVLLFVPSSLHCKTTKALVIGVQDGDTITVLQNKKQYKIRLYGIDCPEKGQAYGNKAKQFTSALTYKKTVELVPYDVDKYRRIVALVKVNGLNVNEELIRNGYAWRYTKYCKESFCNDWVGYEYQARQSRLGLWQDKSAMPPWEWRHSSQKQQQIVSNSLGREKQGKDYQAKREAVSGGSLHGNRKSHVYHNSGCQHYNCKNCTRDFRSSSEARAAGYRPCGNCGG